MAEVGVSEAREALHALARRRDCPAQLVAMLADVISAIENRDSEINWLRAQVVSRDATIKALLATVSRGCQ